MTTARTWLARLIVGAVLAAGFGVGVAVSASAHDVLISSDPTDGTTLRSVPSTVSFTFDQPVQNFDPVVSLIGPDGKQYATGTPRISGNVVTGNVAPVPAGAYIAAYRIVSADGHPVTGEVRFTLAAGAAAVPGTAASGAATSGTATAGAAASGAATSGAATVPGSPGGAAPSSGGGLSAGIWIGLVVAVLLIAAAAVVLFRRPRGGPPAGAPKADRDY